METSKYTRILYGKPSFVEGMARILDFGDTLTDYNRSPDPDAIAIRSDWKAVGDDLVRAIKTVERELGKPKRAVKRR